MIDLTPLDVRKKKGDFRRVVRGYDSELVDDFLDMVAERLEELVKQNVALTERAEHLQEQVGSFREREKALNEALVTAQQLRSEARAQSEREVEITRREAQSQAERIVEEGHRSFRELTREIDALSARRRQFLRTFRVMLERYASDLELEEERLQGETAELPRVREVRQTGANGEVSGEKRPEPEPSQEQNEGENGEQELDESLEQEQEWLSSLVGDGDSEEKD